MNHGHGEMVCALSLSLSNKQTFTSYYKLPSYKGSRERGKNVVGISLAPCHDDALDVVLVYILSNSSTWKSLPGLPITRSFHGCDRIYLESVRYLIVYGGTRIDNGGWGIDFGDILFLKLDAANSTWVSMPGVQLPGLQRYS